VDVPPRVISKHEPSYSDEARRAGVNTVVSATLVVSVDGVPENIRILHGAGFGLDENAAQAVSAWRFQPGTRQGVPVACTARIEVSFRLPIPQHDNQLVRLNFTLPSGGTRPELVQGRIPDNPKDSRDARVLASLSVEADGSVQKASILETTSPEWAEAVLRDLRSWRFRPGTANGQPAEVEGIFELVHGSPPGAPSDAAQSAISPADAPDMRGSVTGPAPDPNWQPKTADEFLARGYARLRLHQYPQAKADADDALKLEPNSVIAQFLHGRDAYEEKDYATALDDFNKVIGQKPDWPDAYLYRGLAYSYRGDHQRALPDYQKAIQLNPYLASAYNSLGWAYSELGQLDQAKANLDKAIELEPDFIRARENRAKLFAKQREFDAERQELSIILALSPNNQWAKDTKEALLQLQSSR
jgi:TonB family protein